MNRNINQLLEKYWGGETTLQEEKDIKAYFASGNIAEEHKEYAPMFSLFSIQREDSYDRDLTSVIEESIGEAKSDTAAPSQGSAKVFQLRKFVMAAAAVFAIVMTAVIVMNQEDNSITNTPAIASNKIILDGSDDSEEALKITKEALVFLSGKLKKNGKKVKSGIQNLDKINVVN